MSKKRKRKEKRQRFEHVTDVMRRQSIDVMAGSGDDELIMGSVALVVSAKQEPLVKAGTKSGHESRCGVDITLHSNVLRDEEGPQVAYQILTMMRDQMGMVYKALDTSRERAKAEMAKRGLELVHYKDLTEGSKP